MMVSAARRDVLKGLGLIAVEVGGVAAMLSPAAAQAAGAALKVLTPVEAQVLAAFGEALVPGARAAGIVAYVDDQLARDPVQGLLMIRYLDVPPPWRGFYHTALVAVEAYALQRFGMGFAELDAGQAAAMIGEIAFKPAENWAGPPSPLVYFALRADAIDVVYGTEAGFEKLGVPYMAHIAPDPKW
jgi:hypothetical protein